MLSADQLEARTRTLGASEIAAVAGISPWAGPLDVWMRKRRGRDGEIPPMIEASPPEGAMRIGHAFEPAIARMVAEDLAIDPALLVEPTSAAVCAGEPWASATPDRLLPDGTGLEIKMVGSRLAHHWRNGVPGYVRAQAQWQAKCADLDGVHVAPVIGGTDYQRHYTPRDESLIKSLMDIGRDFWARNVVGNVAPEGDGEALLTLARLRYPVETLDAAEAPPGATEIAAELLTLRTSIKAARDRERVLQAEMCGLLGEHSAMAGDWGRATWKAQAGSIKWRAVAEEIAGSPIADAITDRHRGESRRRFFFYPKK